MNDADRKALEQSCRDTEGCSPKFRAGFCNGFKAACEWRDSQVGEPIFWYRPRVDGAYEGPIHQSKIEDVRKNSGAWVPLFTTPPTAQINQQLLFEALESVETVLADAYHRHFAECCGRGQGGCCGDFIEQWTAEDHKILDTLSPIQRKLQAALQAARGDTK